jgi:hypothetical protein
VNTAATRTALVRRGYSPEQAHLAMTSAYRDGGYALSRHRVSYSYDEGGDGFMITPLPWPGDGELTVVPDDSYHPPGSCDACALPPDRGRGYYQDGGVPEILETIELVDAHLDADTAQAYRDQPLAGHWSRIAKAQSEANEAVEALAGVTGENPRKGVCDTWEHVCEELADTACAGLLGIQHVTKDARQTWVIFLAALDKARSRVPGESPFPPESGMTRQAAEDAEQGMK